MTDAHRPTPSSVPETAGRTGRNLSADDVLPPVRAPSAGFLLQLFFVPMVIVTIIVAVWLLFSWLAHMSTSPQDLLKNLENLDKQSWQEALTLAQLLRDPAQKELRSDPKLAAQLSKILERELQVDLPAGKDQLAHVDFRIYLARALGSLDIPDGVPALRLAATHEHNAQDIPVRRGALQAVSLLAGHLGGEPLREADPLLLAAVAECSRSQSDDPIEDTPRGQLRAVAAYTLGLLGGGEATPRLEEMLDDAFPDARYNATTGLARLGNIEALVGLKEMLDPNNRSYEPYEKETGIAPADQRYVDAEQLEANRQSRVTWKRDLVLRNGLQAAGMLIERNPAAGKHPNLAAAVATLTENRDDLSADVRTELKRVQQLMSAP